MRQPVVDRPQKYGRARLDLAMPVPLKTALAHAAAERGANLALIVEEAVRLHPDVIPWLKEPEPDQAPAPEPAALTVAEVTRRLGVSRQRVHALVKAGHLKADRDGRLLTIAADELARFERERARKP